MKCLQNANFEETHKLFDYKLGHVRPDVSIFPHSSASSRVVCWLLAHSLLSWPGLVRASLLLATRFLNCGYGFSRKIPFSLINSSDKQLLQLILCCRILRRCVHHIYRIVFHVNVERLPVQHEHLRLYCANLKWHRNLSKVWRSTSRSTRWSLALICYRRCVVPKSSFLCVNKSPIRNDFVPAYLRATRYRSFSLSRNKKLNLKPSSGRSQENKMS